MKKILSACLVFLTLILVMLPLDSANAAILDGNTSKVDYDNTDPGRYKIDIDLTNQILTVYDTASGSVAMQGLCSTGTKKTPTGSGTFRMGDMKERFGYFVAYGQYAQYWSQVTRGIYIHSVLYNSARTSSMSRSAYNDLGSAVSHGCVRTMPEIAQFIFYNCPPGTTCVISKRAANSALVKQLKAAMPSYSRYVQPQDTKAFPPEIPAVVPKDKTPLRTGFSSTNDKTICYLNANARVTLLQIGPDWCKVRTSSGKLGYIRTMYLSLNADQPMQQDGFIAAEKTYLYKTASTSAKRLLTIPKNSVIPITGVHNSSWYLASIDGVAGYIRAKKVKNAAPGVPLPSGEKETLVRDGIIANFRSGPGTNYSVIAQFAAGTTVKIISKSGGWYHCEVDSQKGYFHKVCLVL